MNNNNFFNGVDNSNNNTTPNPTPSTPINNLNSTPTQPQINNGVSATNGSINGQFNNQNGNSLSNANISETSKFIQPTVDNTPQQPSINPVNEFNPQTVNPTTQPQVNNINSIPQNNNINPVSQNSFQSNNVNPMPQQNVGSTSQPTNNSASTNDEELLRAFIGNNYEKITTRPFNFAGFFFTTFYMFYRKMFLYAILLFLVNLVVLNVINNFIVTLAFNVAVGFLVNKIYLFYAKKKIDKIKFQNQQKDINELKGLCSAKGGTSVGKIFLGFLAEIGIAFVVLFVMLIAGIGGMVGSLFNPDNWNITINGNEINNNDTDNGTNNSTSTKDATLVEDVTVSGYSCFGLKCNVSIEESGNYVDYVFGASNVDLFNVLDDYSDYIKVNIYYTQKGSEKTIVDYKIYLKSNNEEITKQVKTEDELRSKIGLYSIGTHTESFTLTEVGMTGFGYKDDKSYTYVDYTLVDSKNNEYEMKYIIPDGSKGLDLVEGNTYTITFEVAEDTFGYEFYIKSVN